MKKLNLLVLFFVSLFFVLPNVYANIAISPLKHELKVEQGKTVTKTIKITNEGDSPITLYTSTEDFISGDNTGKPKFIKPEDQESTELSLANWIKIHEKNITLSVGETREISFDITVPEKGEPGGHYGAIFFSPGIQGNAEVAFAQRIGVLLLIEVPGEIIIDGNLENFQIGSILNDNFVENNNFKKLPIQFKSNFKNNGNIHLKPKGKIELIDEDGINLKNIGKETLASPTGAFIGEKLVDYIPVNDFLGSVLPNSSRVFNSTWEGFGYSILNEDGTKSVKFKGLNEYYEDKASEKQAYLMFWEQIHTKKVKKTITADFTLYYESKDKKKNNFTKREKFQIEYTQKYIGLNYYMLSGIGFFIIILSIYFIIHLPKARAKKEEELRKKIIKEMRNK